MRLIQFILVVGSGVMLSCASQPDAQKIIDRTIETYGGDRYTRSTVAFDFRERHYIAMHNGGQFQYERSFTDSTGRKIRDVLTNDGFYREVNGTRVNLVDTLREAYTNSVNSVIYFALLPYKLNDPAVRKKYVGTVTLKGQEYHKIEVSFNEKGGGKDYRDVFYYWINTDDYTLQHLAYSEEGERFRDAYNLRDVNGIRFTDYVNYQSDATETTPLIQYDSLFEAGQLQELSRIELKNIQVSVP